MTAVVTDAREAAAPGQPLDGAEVRPDGVVPLRRLGRAPFRVLAFGGGALVGWGLMDHERAFAGQVADRLAQRSGRGVDLDVIVDLDPLRPESVQAVSGLRIGRYDAIVVVLGERPALAKVGRAAYRSGFEALVRALHGEAARCAPVLVVDSARALLAVSSAGWQQRRAMAAAARFQDLAQDVAEQGRIVVQELAPPSTALGWGRQFAVASLRSWADAVVGELLPRLEASELVEGADTPTAMRSRPQDERYRQRAVDSMRLRRGEQDAVLERIVRRARSAYGAASAMVTVVDRDVVWVKASTAPVQDMRRDASFCDLTVRDDRVTIVNDTVREARIDAPPATVDGAPVVFYAGEPIHSVDGYRIGALCLVDSAARYMRPQQFAQLHELAGEVERELWAQSLGVRR